MATESTRDVLPVEREVYILTNLNGAHRGVYKSKEQLSEGVDLWMKKVPKESLIYELWYAPGEAEITWEFAYVSTDDRDEAMVLVLHFYNPDFFFPKVMGVNLLKQTEPTNE